MSPPDTPSEGQTEYNAGDARWTPQGLAPGGFYFGTLIHEFGHGHGMSHPHDNGGRSSVMRDSSTESGYVEETSPFNYTLGDFGLNQGVYTMMSYMDGWQLSPYGQPSSNAGYGFIGSLMALDIAVIQDKYGVNEEWATGNNTYLLRDENVAAQFDADGNMTREPTSYKSIWDAGGIDEIVYSGARNTNIDLRAATLRYEPGGGGWISYAFGIHGGFTIANGVTIENATSGSGNDTLRGNAADNRLDAGAGNDFLWLMDGGTDTAIGGDGNDVFLFGATMTGVDAADGGAGTDQIALQGDYAGAEAILFGTGVIGFENLAILPGNDTRFGDAGTNFYDYDVTTRDVNVAAGVQVVVDANRLRVGEDFTFNGSAETDGSFFIYGGGGVDRLTGGAMNDVFLFGPQGQWSSSDVIVGGAGIDQLALRGNYTLTFGAGQLVSIENIGLLSAHDTRFGALGTNYNYDITMVDANVAPGVQMIVDGAKLRAGEMFAFNGAAETDGTFRVFGGLAGDTIGGGQGNDLIQGNGGGDMLSGNGGGDTFRYLSTSDSTAGAVDHILDFTPGTDGIDLTRIDANTLADGNQAFSWIGSNAFTGAGAASAGELRAYQNGGSWFVEGDTDGNGTADLVIQLTLQGPTPLGADAFLL